LKRARYHTHFYEREREMNRFIFYVVFILLYPLGCSHTNSNDQKESKIATFEGVKTLIPPEGNSELYTVICNNGFRTTATLAELNSNQKVCSVGEPNPEVKEYCLIEGGINYVACLRAASVQHAKFCEEDTHDGTPRETACWATTSYEHAKFCEEDTHDETPRETACWATTSYEHAKFCEEDTDDGTQQEFDCWKKNNL
jgi:hypothetical protein